ncbi:MAG: hypothetical protein HQK66_03220 [Desulfamplus sp.]|nr:hypothetical protein [Desulfamplus sp.]
MKWGDGGESLSWENALEDKKTKRDRDNSMKCKNSTKAEGQNLNEIFLFDIILHLILNFNTFKNMASPFQDIQSAFQNIRNAFQKYFRIAGMLFKNIQSAFQDMGQGIPKIVK